MEKEVGPIVIVFSRKNKLEDEEIRKIIRQLSSSGVSKICIVTDEYQIRVPEKFVYTIIPNLGIVIEHFKSDIADFCRKKCAVVITEEKYLTNFSDFNVIRISSFNDFINICEDIIRASKKYAIYLELPKINCKKCGYKSCWDFAEAIVRGDETLQKCVVLNTMHKLTIIHKGEIIMLNPWVENLFYNIIRSMLSALKNVKITGKEKIILNVSDF